MGKTRLRGECFYDGSLGCELIMRARMKLSVVNTIVHRWSNEKNDVYHMCERDVNDTDGHVLL